MAAPSKNPVVIPTLDEFRTQLRRHGLKATRQRLAVHEAMQELVHASADEVCEALRLRGSDLPVSSVYNILSQMASCHIYGQRMSASNKMYFDVVGAPHLHLYDRVNDRWRDLPDSPVIADVNKELRRHKFKGYSIEDIDIQIIARPTRKTKQI